MTHTFPPLLDREHLPHRVLAIAPHPDDEVLGCGGVLAFHAGRGDRVRVLFLTDGAGVAGDGEQARRRVEEARAACEVLGVEDLRWLGFADGGLVGAGELVERLAAQVAEFEPELVYAPSPFEHHPDHRAAFEALVGALEGHEDVLVMLWGVNATPPATVAVDVTPFRQLKGRALGCHASQCEGTGLAEKAAALDLARTLDVDVPGVLAVERFARVTAERLPALARIAAALLEAAPRAADLEGLPRATAVISTWNKRGDVRENLAAVYRQTLPFERVVVVDNASSDGTAAMIRREFPRVHLVEMPHSRYGACETFNIGFAQAETPLVAILDDDIVMPPEWLERTTRRIVREPESTAIVSTKVVEPGMPESYRRAAAVNSERYMPTFRGCASLARTEALREAGWYDERLFIYGNERDLTCRLLNRGYRVLQYPGVEVFHKTPFGIKPGKRSLYYHARNAWLTMLKYAPARDLAAMPWRVVCSVLLRPAEREAAGEVADATGTIGVGRSLRETPGAWWIVTKAGLSVLWNLPYCLARREPCHHPDFELPLS